MDDFWGADSDQLEQHARRMRVAAEHLAELQDRLGGLVLDESLWHGPDATAFREEWRSRALLPSRIARDEVSRLATELRGHAHEQEDISGGGAASALGASGASRASGASSGSGHATGPATGDRPALTSRTDSGLLWGTSPMLGTGPDGIQIGTRGPLLIDLSDQLGDRQVCPPIDLRVFQRAVDAGNFIGCTGLPPTR